MAPAVGVRGGVLCALGGAKLVMSWADRREGGGEEVESPCESRTRVADEDGD